jgi:hypothetical protein
VLTVVPLREHSCLDIASSLRRLADEFAGGKHPDVQFVVVTLGRATAGVTVEAYGQCSPLEVAGLLARSVLLAE